MGADFFDRELRRSLLTSPDSVAAHQWMGDLCVRHRVAPLPGDPIRDVRTRCDRHLHGDLRDSFHGLVEFEGGTIGHLISTYTSVPKIERLQLFGESCWAVAEGIGSGMSTCCIYQDGAYHDLALPLDDQAGTDTLGYWVEDRYFVDCLRDNRLPAPPAADLRDAVASMDLVDAVLSVW